MERICREVFITPLISKQNSFLPGRDRRVHNPSLISRQILLHQSANPPSSVGKSPFISRQIPLHQSANPPSSVGFDPAFVVVRDEALGCILRGRSGIRLFLFGEA